MRSLGPFSLATLRSTGGVEPRYFPTTSDKRFRPSIRITTTITTTTTTMTATGVSPSIVAERKKGKSARTGNDVRALSVRSIGFDRSIDRSITKSRIASNESSERKIPRFSLSSFHGGRDAKVVRNIQMRFEIALFPDVLSSRDV